jgi:hypothetical protein
MTMVYKPKIKTISPLELPCRKKMYNSREEADDMIRYIMENRVAHEIRAYKCSICGFWHLTSRFT